MPYSTQAGPRDYGKMFLYLGHIVAACFPVLLLATSGLIAHEYGTISVTFSVVAICVMFGLRNSDEWIASLWSAGANAGFIGGIGWLMLLPITEGFVDGFIEGLTSSSGSVQNFGPELAPVASLGCFLIGFYFKRLRSY
jgi:hypothetical protein